MTRFPQFGGVPCGRPAGLTSVTRWLLVVAGCIGLELVQPALLAESEANPAVATSAPAASPAIPEPATAPASLAPDTVLYPSGQDSRAAAGSPFDESTSSRLWPVMGVLLIAGGAWVWFKRGQLAARVNGRTLIGIEETRSLGNRQFLVVASCDGRRFLLGVSPGRISTLADLDDLPAGELPGAPEGSA